ncbi:MAG TPA: hypothetical protein VE621_06045, partial [Bryobacteraceae bacterium]|nr:hypothetical protein [Bryobacteraceae bacterium]
TINSLEASDRPRDKVQATVDLNVLRFGQILQGRLLMVSPGALVPNNDYTLSEQERKLPVRIRGRSRHNVVRLQLPEGFVLDELPESLKVTSTFGDYEVSWKVHDRELLFEQSVRFHNLTVPAAQYADVRAFFSKFSGTQTQAVVFEKK